MPGHRSQLGGEGQETQETQETVFIRAGSIALVLWGRDKLALESGIADDLPAGSGGVVLTHNVRPEPEVDQMIAAAGGAGATFTRASYHAM